MKRLCTAFAFCLIFVTLLVQAHEFWLQPGQFFVESGQVVPIDVLVGEHFNGEQSEGKKNRIVQYKHWAAGLEEDVVPKLADGHYGTTSLRLTAPGTHLIALANTNKYLEMRADSFLLYLQEDGLDDVVKLRQQRSQSQTRSREFYRRCVKTMIQAGSVRAGDRTFALDTGMPLELIPQQNPYSIKPGAWVAFKVIFQHKPLSNVLVRHWNRATFTGKVEPGKIPNGLTQERQRTNSQGIVRFRLKTGANMVSAVHMTPYADTKQADWQSYWGSLTFGCR